MMWGLFVLLFSWSAFGLTDVSMPHSFSDSAIIYASQHNANFDTLTQYHNSLLDTLDGNFIRFLDFEGGDSTLGRIQADTIRSNPDVDSIAGGVYWDVGRLGVDSIQGVGVIGGDPVVDSLQGGVYWDVGRLDVDTVGTSPVIEGKLTVDTVDGLASIGGNPTADSLQGGVYWDVGRLDVDTVGTGTVVEGKLTVDTIDGLSALVGNPVIDSIQGVDVIAGNPVIDSIQGVGIISGGASGLSLFDDDSNGITILDGGNVGFGTDSPSCAFDVAGKGHKIQLSDSGDGGSARIRIGHDVGQGGYIAVHDDAGATKALISSYNNSFFLTSNVGIGTNSPSSTLDVDGDVHVSGDLYTEEYQSCASCEASVAGWSSTTQNYIAYKSVGKRVMVTFRISGTSNADSVSFDVPDSAATGYWNGVAAATDDGTAANTPARVQILTNSSSIYVQKAWNSSDGWTSSGTKSVTGSISFEAQ